MKDRKKIFIPLTLDNSTKSLFSIKQMIGIFLFVILFVVFQLGMLKLYDGLLLNVNGRGLITIVVDVIGTYIIIFVFRKLILQENKMIRAYQLNQHLQKTDISFCWDIFSIRDGHIFYCSGMQGVVVKLSHGYLLDRAPDQETMHRDLVKQALGNMTKQGYKFIYYNREIKDSNLKPLEETERRLHKYADTSIYNTANQIIKHTYKACQAIANTEVEYYIILADRMDTIKKLDHIANEFINALHGSIYVDLELLSDEGIWEFITSLFGVSYINTSALLSKKFREEEIQLVTIDKINYIKEPETTSQTTEEVLPVAPERDTNWDFLNDASDLVEPDYNNDEEDDVLL